jgi:hypothetical protein
MTRKTEGPVRRAEVEAAGAENESDAAGTLPSYRTEQREENFGGERGTAADRGL